MSYSLTLHCGCSVYVACDPATLARDIAGLIEGGYRLERFTMIDLFPQTFHIEAIAQLRKA